MAFPVHFPTPSGALLPYTRGSLQGGWILGALRAPTYVVSPTQQTHHNSAPLCLFIILQLSTFIFYIFQKEREGCEYGRGTNNKKTEGRRAMAAGPSG